MRIHTRCLLSIDSWLLMRRGLASNSDMMMMMMMMGFESSTRVPIRPAHGVM